MTDRPRRRRSDPFPSLAEYLAATGITQAGLAQALDITEAQVSRIVRGLQVPRPGLLARIVERTGVAPESFARVYLAKRRQGAA
jgi:transcriptional regulator with XRE-family HTH domain